MQEITSVQEAINLIVGNDSEFGKFIKKSPLMPFWFRGQSNFEWELVPGVFRKDLSNDYLYDEYNMLMELRILYPDEFNKCSTTLEWLVLVQHYGLPTRILDWTESILIALYFASQDEQVDGRLAVLKPDQLNSHSSMSRQRFILMADDPDTILRADQSVAPIYNLLWARFTKRFEGDYFSKLFEKIGEDRIKEIINLPIAVYPPRNNPRVTMQSGTFTLHGGSVPSFTTRKNDFGNPVSLDDLNGEFGIIINYLIPKDAKTKIQEDLKRLGIHQASLFPEFDYQTQYIKQKWKRGNQFLE